MRILGRYVIFHWCAFFRARLPVTRARLRVYGDAFALACDLRRKIARISHNGVLVDNFPVFFVFVRFRGISRGVLCLSVSPAMQEPTVMELR